MDFRCLTCALFAPQHERHDSELTRGEGPIEQDLRYLKIIGPLKLIINRCLGGNLSHPGIIVPRIELGMPGGEEKGPFVIAVMIVREGV